MFQWLIAMQLEMNIKPTALSYLMYKNCFKIEGFIKLRKSIFSNNCSKSINWLVFQWLIALQLEMNIKPTALSYLMHIIHLLHFNYYSLKAHVEENDSKLTDWNLMLQKKIPPYTLYSIPTYYTTPHTTYNIV